MVLAGETSSAKGERYPDDLDEHRSLDELMAFEGVINTLEISPMILPHLLHSRILPCHPGWTGQHTKLAKEHLPPAFTLTHPGLQEP
ncbi:hypothetical protein AMTR_s00079p00191220 [Amborella trichopoda]|uniref:Uncharacterized protein n=1 Tax=Amborella trichopoda TaxID=13333 RepID=W1P2H1_AMBTC|nr:hypothetical protein AMTR_s00079p00191220 [Amborella trichopoda]